MYSETLRKCTEGIYTLQKSENRHKVNPSVSKFVRPMVKENVVSILVSVWRSPCVIKQSYTNLNHSDGGETLKIVTTFEGIPTIALWIPILLRTRF